MRRVSPLGGAWLLLLCAAGAHAQTTARYVYDNFDFRNGVQVELPAPAPTPRKVRLTAMHVAELKRLGAQFIPAPVAPRLGMTPGQSLDGFTTGSQQIDALIGESGVRNGVDPVLLYAIMHRESSFRPTAVSPKGARGLMQLMPATAARLGVRDIFDPQQNIEGGVKYVRFLLDMFDGDVRLALAGYNAGEGAVMKYGNRVPPYSETQEYVRRISERYELMRDPSTARRAPRVSRTQIAKLKAAEPPPLVYERSVFAVRTPDGKLRLVSQ
jgi:soluble lytic murein transglycosylase-like protein